MGLARTFYNTPNFIVLDEPTSSLDAAFENRFLSIIRNTRSEVAIIIINTHNKRILTMADFILAIKMGRQKLFDSKENIKKKMNLPYKMKWTRKIANILIKLLQIFFQIIGLI